MNVKIVYVYEDGKVVVKWITKTLKIELKSTKDL
jgi:hypothetical protein